MIISPRTTPAARPDHSALSRQSGTAFVFFVKLFAKAAVDLRSLRSLTFRLMLGLLVPVAALHAQNYANPYTFSTLAGATAGSSDGTGASAQFQNPSNVAVDSSGNVYVADTGNHTIRKITPAGVVTTFAGTAGAAGSADGTGAAARFSGPRGVAVDGSGNVFVADMGNHTIRKITPARVVTTLAGSVGTSDQADGAGSAALFANPYGIAVDGSDNLYVTDIGNNNIRKITLAGNVTTLAGSTAGATGSQGSTDGVGTAARFNTPYGIGVDSAGNLFVADFGNNVIRKVTPTGTVSTYAGTGGGGALDGTLLAANFDGPVAVAVDAAGNVFVTDNVDKTIREITVAGEVTTVGGSSAQVGLVNATGSIARMYSSYGLAVDSSENLYFVDFVYNIVRKAVPATVALGAPNELIGWGSGTHYQLGLAHTAGSTSPVTVAGLDGYKITAVASSANHVLALVSDGSLLAWGLNAAGQLGDNSTNYTSDPVPVFSSGALAGKTVTAVAVNDVSSYALTSDGKVFAWGNNSHGELGNNSTTNSLVPVAVSTSGVMAGKTITAIAVGDGCAFALSSDGLVFSWGDNSFGQLGNGSGAGNSLVPVAVTMSGVLSGKTVTAIAAGATGSDSVYALASDGHVYSWGLNGSAGRLGDNTTTLAGTPVAVYTAGYLAGKTIVAIAAGQANGYALSSMGEAFSWGANDAKQLGCGPIGGVTIGTGSQVPVPVLSSGALGGKIIASIGAGSLSAYVLATDGTLYSWGGGSLGRTSGATDVPGAIDQSGALSGLQITKLQAGASANTFFVLASPSSLAFTTQPTSQTVTAGGSVTFTAAATGSPAPTYQWQKGGVTIAGATSASYSIASVVAGNAGNYTVVATNTGGSLTSVTATLTVNVPPSFTTQPTSATVTAGGAVSFTVAASGNPTPTYQWQKGGVTITGATSATYSIASVVAGDAGSYTAVATNSAGTATSTAATLTVNAAPSAPSITTQPASVTVIAGSTASFTVAASGNPAPTYQWKKGGVAITGATSATYLIASVVAGDAGNYTVVATNSAGTATSVTATLTVNAAPAAPLITTQPTNVTTTVGSTASFTVAVSGNPAPTYQWQKGGVAISGATSATYSIASVVSGDAGNYTVVATNGSGTATSTVATLTISVTTSAPAITTQPTSATVTAGSSVSFTVAASGTPTPTYQWQKDGTSISGATSATYTIASVAVGDAGNYTAVATNSVGSATSTAATLTVSPATVSPAFTTQPSSVTVAPGGTASFTVAASGNPAPTYQWYFGGTAIGGATSATLSLTNVQAANAGDYYATAANSGGSANSATAKLTVQAPAPLTLLASQPVTIGHDVAISATGASGTTQWQVSTDVGVTWKNLSDGSAYSGTTTSILEVLKVTAAQNGYLYHCVVSTTASSSTKLIVMDAFFPFPTSVGPDSLGNLYVSDASAQTIQKINTTDQVVLVAGSKGVSGSTDGSGAAAKFNQPGALVAATDGSLSVSDTANDTIRNITASGAVTTLAGSAAAKGGTDGTGAAARFLSPIGIARDASGALFVADSLNDTIRKITSAGVVTTFAGSAGTAGSTDAAGANARFTNPAGVAVDPSGNVFVADAANNTIRKITSAGIVTTLAGTAGASGTADGTGATARFNNPGGLVISGAGDLYLADTGNSTIRKITSAGVVTTIAGMAGTPGLMDGSGSYAWFDLPEGVTIGTDGNLYVADTGNAVVRKVTLAGVVTTLPLTAGPTGTSTTPTGTTGSSHSSGGGAIALWFVGLFALVVALRFGPAYFGIRSADTWKKTYL